MSGNFEISPSLAWAQTGLTSEPRAWMIEGTQRGVRHTHQAEPTSSDSLSKHFLIPALNFMHRVIDKASPALRGFRATAGPCTALEEALCGLREELIFSRNLLYRVFATGRPVMLNPELSQQIYFIAREAVTNALYARATTIEAEVEYWRNRLRVVVRDNGSAINPQIVRSGRDSNWGLLDMRERAETIGAQFKVWSRKGAGTEVEISIPTRRGRYIDMILHG